MLKNLKIRSRLLVSYAIILMLTVIISVTAISKLNGANQNLHEFSNGAMTARSLVRNSRMSTNTAARRYGNFKGQCNLRVQCKACG